MLQDYRMHQSQFPMGHVQTWSSTPNVQSTKAWRTMVVTWQPFLRKREIWKGKIPQLPSVYLSKGVHQMMRESAGLGFRPPLRASCDERLFI